MKNRILFNRNLLIIYGITLMAVMGVSIIAPVLPEIAKTFKTDKAYLLVALFPLPGILLSPFVGILADRYGRKRILVPSLFLFALAGTACAFTTNFNTLLVLRILQGIGAMPLSALNQTIIGDLFVKESRLKAMGYNGSVLSIGTLSYPLIGGTIALLGWYYPFLLSILAVPIGLLSLLVLNVPRIEKQGSLNDYLLNAVHTLRQRKTYSLLFVTLITFLLLYGFFITTMPFYLKLSFNASPFTRGLFISTASVGTILFSYHLSTISGFIRQHRQIIIAFVLYSFSIVCITFIKNEYLVLAVIFIYGAANGINMPNVASLLANNTTPKNRGAVMSVNSMVIRTGQFFGPMIFGLIKGRYGIETAMQTGLIIACIATVIVALLVLPPDSKTHGN